MDRIEEIRKYKERKDFEKERAETERMNENERLMGEIRKLEPRIKELIRTANACVECGIPINGEYRNKEGDKIMFKADGVRHNIGFIRFIHGQNDTEIKEMGIKDDFGFRTDGKNIYGVRGERCEIDIPSNNDMNKFLWKFNRFERLFYEYVDEVINDG